MRDIYYIPHNTAKVTKQVFKSFVPRFEQACRIDRAFYELHQSFFLLLQRLKMRVASSANKFCRIF